MQWIIILAVIAGIVVIFGPKTQFYVKYFADESAQNQEEGIQGNKSATPSAPSVPQDPSVLPTNDYYVKGGLNGILKRPSIEISPSEPYYLAITIIYLLKPYHMVPKVVIK